MMNWVCIDGELLPESDAKVSVFDHGLLYGDGLFETMRAYNGKVFALDKHLERMREGAEILRLPLSFKKTALETLIQETLRKNNLSEAYIRVTFTRGTGPIGLDPSLCPKGCLIIMVKEPSPDKLQGEGISLGICPVIRNHNSALPPAIKSLNFLNNILAKIWAKENGFAEALLLNQAGFITETTVSNIFFIKDKRLYTPSLESGILSGITREEVICVAGNIGLPVAEGLFIPEELNLADEIFLTNSGSEIIPVASLDGNLVGKSKAEKITQLLHKELKKSINKACNQGF